jgi:hypothetical protein
MSVVVIPDGRRSSMGGRKEGKARARPYAFSGRELYWIGILFMPLVYVACNLVMLG